ncbi:MAG: 16S rRNA (guanine(527)-N(7))-methyltransferase RsmG [Steroidobacteraceae bacterium]
MSGGDERAPLVGDARLIERTRLIEHARLLNVALTDAAAERLLRLLDELTEWSQAYSLTSIRRREEMLTRHLLDSLSIHEELEGETVADVGTGAGFPGLPLAVVNPERRFTLVDSSSKKVRFVTHAVRALALDNVTVAHSRAEGLHPQIPFDTVAARAVAALPELLATVRGLCGPGTRVLAMKGRYPSAEIAAVRPPWHIVRSRPLKVPGLDEERHLIVAECADSDSIRP